MYDRAPSLNSLFLSSASDASIQIAEAEDQGPYNTADSSQSNEPELSKVAQLMISAYHQHGVERTTTLRAALSAHRGEDESTAAGNHGDVRLRLPWRDLLARVTREHTELTAEEDRSMRTDSLFQAAIRKGSEDLARLLSGSHTSGSEPREKSISISFIPTNPTCLHHDLEELAQALQLFGGGSPCGGDLANEWAPF